MGVYIYLIYLMRSLKNVEIYCNGYKVGIYYAILQGYIMVNEKFSVLLGVFGKNKLVITSAATVCFYFY